MSSLDEKLRAIAADLSSLSVSEDYAVTAIKAVFQEEGYHIECPPKVTDATLYPMLWSIANGYHKGQEWYNRFEKELEQAIKESGISGTGAELLQSLTYARIVNTAAKRAAGIEEDK